MKMTATEHALFRSFLEGPLLVGELPEAGTFPYPALGVPECASADRSLNLQQKLGHLCESALAVLLEASPRFELLCRNLQIQLDAHTTIGELDFLVRDLGNDGQLIHLELAAKFYLAVPTEVGLKLPGPDARDNYFRKIQRLREHQLVLTCKHRDALPDEYRKEAIVARQLIYGCVFDPIPMDECYCEDSTSKMPKSAQATAEFINPYYRRGRWLTIDQCQQHFPPGTEFRIIPKELWPVPLEFFDDIQLEKWTPQSCADRCVMLRINGDTVPYFVAPSGYPKHCDS